MELGTDGKYHLSVPGLWAGQVEQRLRARHIVRMQTTTCREHPSPLEPEPSSRHDLDDDELAFIIPS